MPLAGETLRAIKEHRNVYSNAFAEGFIFHRATVTVAVMRENKNHVFLLANVAEPILIFRNNVRAPNYPAVFRESIKALKTFFADMNHFSSPPVYPRINIAFHDFNSENFSDFSVDTFRKKGTN